jgi:hypothetical protein
MAMTAEKNLRAFQEKSNTSLNLSVLANAVSRCEAPSAASRDRKIRGGTAVSCLEAGKATEDGLFKTSTARSLLQQRDFRQVNQ